MPNYINSANMDLPVPIVGQETGPQWATDINNCFSIIDAHDHSSGNGVPITPDGININSNLTFNNVWSATNLKAVTFYSQSAALTGTNFMSVVGGNMYFNDGSGNQIPITSGGGVAGSPGSIGSLAAPAAATYSAGSKLFTWTADSGKSAAMDNGAVTIRETNVASAKGVTIASASSLAADYQLTLPSALPGSTQYMTSTSGGVLSFATADSIGSAMSSTGANAVAASRTRATGTTVAAGGVALSASCAVANTTSGTYADITNLTVTITTSGRPVYIGFIGDGTVGSSGSTFEVSGTVNSSSNQLFGFVKFFRDASAIDEVSMLVQGQTNGNTIANRVPCSTISFIDAVAAGTYVYKAQYKVVSSGITSAQFNANLMKMIAYEL